MHSWKDTLDYSNNTMESAIQYEKFMNVSKLSLPPPALSFVLSDVFQGIEPSDYIGHAHRLCLPFECIRWDVTVFV